MKPLLFLALLSASTLTWGSAIEALTFSTPLHEQRYRQLTYELRCLVCQNENLADSNADLAKDLRERIYQMLESGASDQQIIDFMVERYGEFVLFRPRFNLETLLLWLGPLLLLAIGCTIVVVFVRRRAPADSYSEADHRRARNLLEH